MSLERYSNSRSCRLYSDIFMLHTLNPIEHVYTVYDLVYKTRDTLVVGGYSDGRLAGYLLAYRPRGDLVYAYAWRAPPSLLRLAGDIVCRADRLVLQLSKGLNPSGYVDTLSRCGFACTRRRFVDMAVLSPEEFKPFHSGGLEVVELDESWAEEYSELEKPRRGVSVEEARRILSSLRCVGAVVDGRLAGVACLCAQTMLAWVICNVYTHPSHRGRGVAKTLTSVLVERALAAGAKPLLHVEAGNRIAFRVYARLGFRAVAAREWLFCEKKHS